MFPHPQQRFKTLQRRKIITPLHLKDSVTDTAVTDRLVYNHSKCYVVPTIKTDQYKHSFFVEPVLDWNHLDGSIAETGSVEDFRSNLSLQLGLVCDTFSLSLPLRLCHFWILQRTHSYSADTSLTGYFC